ARHRCRVRDALRRRLLLLHRGEAGLHLLQPGGRRSLRAAVRAEPGRGGGPPARRGRDPHPGGRRRAAGGLGRAAGAAAPGGRRGTRVPAAGATARAATAVRGAHAAARPGHAPDGAGRARRAAPAGVPALGGRARQPAVRQAPRGPPAGGGGALFVRVPPVLLSTSSCYPASTESAFADAARLRYDGMEVMVWKWPETRDPGRLLAFAGTYGVPVLAIHSPTLLLTQRVWGTDAWGKIDRSVELAEAVGAEVVVVHPPFRWQREY